MLDDINSFHMSGRASPTLAWITALLIIHDSLASVARPSDYDSLFMQRAWGR